MNTVLIVGVETVSGGNFAAVWSGHSSVVGVPLNHPTGLNVRCAIKRCDHQPQSIAELLAEIRPDHVVLCGPAANSCWDDVLPTAAVLSATRHWISAVAASSARLTYISSAAIFTGPWIFHAENSTSFCPSITATEFRALEDLVSTSAPESLIVRTHVFGWSARSEGAWLENCLRTLESRGAHEIDCVRHATPILATDLATIIEQGWQAGLEGCYHAAGAERVSPAKFIRRLAAEFGLESPRLEQHSPLEERASGFGAGETSLQTVKLRRALQVGAPMLTDGLRRLHEQRAGSNKPPLAKVA